MRRNFPAEAATPDMIAEMRALADETRAAIEASQAVLDRCVEEYPASPERQAPPDDASDLLGEIGEGLIHAYRFAKQDGDPRTVLLIEKALFHVGCRLARGMTPAEAGLVCH